MFVSDACYVHLELKSLNKIYMHVIYILLAIRKFCVRQSHTPHFHKIYWFINLTVFLRLIRFPASDCYLAAVSGYTAPRFLVGSPDLK